MLAFVRDAIRMTGDRVAAAATIWLTILAALLGLVLWYHPPPHLGEDFAAFWIAAGLTLDGHVVGAYGTEESIGLAQLFGPRAYPPFFYPPVALLLWVPFALLPRGLALVLWLCATGAAFAASVRALAGRGAIAVALGCPAAIVCGLYGQTGLLSAALLGGAMATVDRAPGFAGVLVGLLAIKPQLAVLTPIVFAVARRWTAFWAAAATVVALIATSVAAFGTQAWVGFAGVITGAYDHNANGVAGFRIYSSPFSAIRLLGGSASSAWTVQALCAVVAVALTVFVARRRPSGAEEMALATAATGFCVPFLGEYELPLFAMPAAWLVSDAMQRGWLPYERVGLLLLFVAPFFIVVAAQSGVPLAPLAIAGLVALVFRRLHG
jgi:hypothetical protein